MKSLKLKFIETPGHGYLVVPKSTFRKVGADSNKVSSYSGHNVLNLYLEEDSDASYFIKHLKDSGIEFTIESTYRNSFNITHNYNPLMFGFQFNHNTKVRLNSGTEAVVVSNGNKTFLQTTTSLYRLPKSNPFSYVNPF
jgi:hypothetical protein